MAPTFKGSQAAAFAASDLGADPEERLGRRKRARLQKAGREAKEELAAEQQPRTQAAWLEKERKDTKLPKAEVEDAENPAKLAPDQEGSAVGKKKAKRLSVANAKKSQKEQRKAEKELNAVTTAPHKGQGKEVRASAAAAELLSKSKGGPAGQQRLIATVAEKVSGDPEKELDLFFVFLELHEKGSDAKTRQLALLSAVAVFKDLVPGYRIREPTEQEKEQKRSREVIALQRHEMGLLGVYKKLLPALEAAMRREPDVFAPALAALLTAASEFNYRQRLIGTAVKHATSPHDGVRVVMSDALREMVETDQRMESSREVVLAIGRLAQATASSRKKGGGRAAGGDDAVGGGDPNVKAQGLRSELFKVLLHVQIGKAEDAALQDEGIDRLEGLDDETRKGLQEGSIMQSASNLRKAEAELLMEIFVVYLRILKQRHLHGKDLMPQVLTGLTRWGQQVNLELLLEVLIELRCLVEESLLQGNDRVSLLGLHCALVLLSGPAQALMTDVSWLADSFKAALKLALPSLHSVHSESSEWPPPQCFFMEGRHLRASKKDLALCLELDSVPALVLRCLDAALKCPQAFGKASDAALAQLIESLFVLAAASDPCIGYALLREGALLLRRHWRLHSILDIEGGLFGLGGVTEKSVSVVWHLQALASSVIPNLANAGKTLASTVVNRRANVADLFPVKDSHKWLSAEVVGHMAALADAPMPPKPAQNEGKAATRARATTAFLSESELAAACLQKSMMMM